MPGTRTAPAATSTVTYKIISFVMVDVDDNQTTVSFYTDDTATPTEVEAVAAALQAISNASLFEIHFADVWAGTKLATNAVSDDYASIADAIRLSYKGGLGGYLRNYVPSPLGDLVLPGNIVDTSDAAYIAWRDATTAVVPAGFTLLNVAFVQNVQRNKGTTP